MPGRLEVSIRCRHMLARAAGRLADSAPVQKAYEGGAGTGIHGARLTAARRLAQGSSGARAAAAGPVALMRGAVTVAAARCAGGACLALLRGALPAAVHASLAEQGRQDPVVAPGRQRQDPVESAEVW